MFDPNRPVYFSGTWHPSSGPKREVIDPATLEVVGRIAETTAEEREAVLDAARGAQRGWARLDAKSRAAVLHRVANRIEATDMRRCAELMSREVGKTYPDAIGELANCAGVFRYFAEMARGEAGKWRAAPRRDRSNSRAMSRWGFPYTSCRSISRCC